MMLIQIELHLKKVLTLIFSYQSDGEVVGFDFNLIAERLYFFSMTLFF